MNECSEGIFFKNHINKQKVVSLAASMVPVVRAIAATSSPVTMSMMAMVMTMVTMAVVSIVSTTMAMTIAAITTHS